MRKELIDKLISLNNTGIKTLSETIAELNNKINELTCVELKKSTIQISQITNIQLLKINYDYETFIEKEKIIIENKILELKETKKKKILEILLLKNKNKILNKKLTMLKISKDRKEDQLETDMISTYLKNVFDKKNILS